MRVSLLSLSDEKQTLIRTVGDFNQMVTKLGLDGSENFTDFTGENHFVKLLDHLTRGKLAKCTTLPTGRAFRMLLGDFSKFFLGRSGDDADYQVLQPG